jgi:hypothetical protein
MQQLAEECDQVARQRDYRFDTIHDEQYLATSLETARFTGDCLIKNQQDSIIADDRSHNAQR